jgi:hypothetical protein
VVAVLAAVERAVLAAAAREQVPERAQVEPRAAVRPAAAVRRIPIAVPKAQAALEARTIRPRPIRPASRSPPLDPER